MCYATVRRGMYVKRSEYWRRVQRAAQSNRLAQALREPERRRVDAPVGMLALQGRLFGREDGGTDVLDLWWEDHGEGKGRLYEPTAQGRRYYSRTAIVRMVARALGVEV